MTSTGAAPEGEGLRETLWVEETFQLLASMTVTVSPGSFRSGLTVLVMMIRSNVIVDANAMRVANKRWAGKGGRNGLGGLSVVASPTMTLLEPMQVTYQV